ncbi:MAG: hypothetical protein H8Z69_04640 [Nanohaloarchaea archaeon]|nr:hypothetical protein [Candidatus Nanohaloarchaea archaeon]
MPELDETLNLKNGDAAELLRELADSIEEGEDLNLEGDGWRVFQPFEDVIPVRLYQDKESLEFMFKLINPDSNQKTQ